MIMPEVLELLNQIGIVCRGKKHSKLESFELGAVIITTSKGCSSLYPDVPTAIELLNGAVLIKSTRCRQQITRLSEVVVRSGLLHVQPMQTIVEAPCKRNKTIS